MSAPVFAPDHKGMLVSASGILKRKESNKGLRYMREQMFEHLQTLATHYYAGNLAVVDEFLQLYCLGQEAREAAKARQEVQG